MGLRTESGRDILGEIRDIGFLLNLTYTTFLSHTHSATGKLANRRSWGQFWGNNGYSGGDLRVELEEIGSLSHI